MFRSYSFFSLFVPKNNNLDNNIRVHYTPKTRTLMIFLYIIKYLIFPEFYLLLD